MRIKFAEKFLKSVNKVKDALVQERVAKVVEKIKQDPFCGKPLTHEFVGYRRLVVTPFRIIYKIEGDTIILNCFEHREDAYEL